MRSGAMLTANLAIKQGKKVFCIPSSISNKYKGTNQLIKNGALLVEDTNEILKHLNIENIGADICRGGSPCPPLKYQHTQNNMANIPKQYQPIYKILSSEPMHINQICKIANQEISGVSSILTMLEIEGYIEQLPGKNFKII